MEGAADEEKSFESVRVTFKGSTKHTEKDDCAACLEGYIFAFLQAIEHKKKNDEPGPLYGWLPSTQVQALCKHFNPSTWDTGNHMPCLCYRRQRQSSTHKTIGVHKMVNPLTLRNSLVWRGLLSSHATN